MHKNCLADHYQFAQFAAAKSESLLVKHGVLQSYIFGPLLFLIHINNLARTIKDCRIHIYADDTVISY